MPLEASFSPKYLHQNHDTPSALNLKCRIFSEGLELPSVHATEPCVLPEIEKSNVCKEPRSNDLIMPNAHQRVPENIGEYKLFIFHKLRIDRGHEG